jgi:hypothetical protein
MNVNCVLFLFELEFSFLIISYPIYFSTQNVLSLILCTVIFHLMVVVINFKHSKISHILISPTFLPWHDFFTLHCISEQPLSTILQSIRTFLPLTNNLQKSRDFNHGFTTTQRSFSQKIFQKDQAFTTRKMI